MKCSNCGWNNVQGETRCIKCGMPLGQSTESSGEAFKGTIQGKQDFNSQPSYISKDEKDKFKRSSGTGDKPELSDSEMIHCPVCGYLCNAQAGTCPKCGASLQAQAVKTVAAQAPETQATDVKPSVNANTDFSGTIDPYRSKKIFKKEIYLERVESADEENEWLSFETDGNDISLNRENLDQENKSITAKLQATIAYTDGTWSIQDHSEYKTTFIQVAEMHELKDGDILLIGNKKFIFHTKLPSA